MKLAKKLELQLNRLFFVSGSIGIVVLFLSTYISTSQIKEKAVNFITSHVKQISLAEIGSQNVSEIDREVHRLYETWKDTQDIGIRVDVFLNDKLVSHAGQLQNFGVMSFSTNEQYDLPSGEKLSVDIDLDLSNQILFDLILFALFGGFLGACFILLRRNLGKVIHAVTNPLEERVTWLTKVASELPNSIKGNLPLENTDINELKSLDESLFAFTKQILALEDRVARTSFDQGRLKMADLLAHNIKGAVRTLKLRIENSKTLSNAEKVKFLVSVNEVSNITNDLLKARREDSFLQQDHSNTKIELIALLQSVIEEKREALGLVSPIEITLLNESDRDVEIFANHSDIKSTFRNIIDNAVEAIKDRGAIQVKATSDSDAATVAISDNGCGIPAEVLPTLMEDGATFGKIEGNGLGLSHAKATMSAMQGKISIQSEVDKGTVVTLQFPLKLITSEAKVIEIHPDQTLVIVDDLQLIHDTYTLKLNHLEQIKRVDLHTVEEFEKWISENGPGELGSRIYLMDYDLGHSTDNGMTLIRRHNLQFESFLITGMASDPKVKQEADDQRVRLLSKDSISNIYFRVLTNLESQENGLGAAR